MSRGYFVINTSTDGDTLVAAVAGRRIKVINVFLIPASAVTVTFKSNTTAISGPLPLSANGGFGPGEAPKGHFRTVAGEALKIGLGSAVSVGGWGVYELEA